MSRIALKYVEVGMQLSKAVSNDAGVKLINEGTVVTDKIIQKLVNGNVRYVFVKREADAVRLEDELSALDARFARTRGKPHMEELRNLLQGHLEELYSC